MAFSGPQDRNQDATVYVGGLDDKVTESLLWELFLQAGPIANVHMPKDRVSGAHQAYGFVEFMNEEDADYAIKIMQMIKLYGKPIKVNKASSHTKTLDTVGANIFVGNLDAEVDEKLLYDTFSAFGVILQPPKIMRDMDTGNSKGFAFINYASFEASDAAIDAMNGQFLCNRPISASYAFKKDSKGERHGSAAERRIAAENPLIRNERPHQHFADKAPEVLAAAALAAQQAALAAQAAPMMPMPSMGPLPPHMRLPPSMGMPPPPMGFPPPMQMPPGFPYPNQLPPHMLMAMGGHMMPPMGFPPGMIPPPPRPQM